MSPDPGLGAGATDAVVADGDPDDRCGVLQIDADGRRTGVLCHVGQGFGHDVVDGDLDRLRQPPVG
jgi:hypothetical protein